MSFTSRDLMSDVLPAEWSFACGDITKVQEPCPDPSKAPEPPPAIAERELNLAVLRDQLREALSLE